MSFGAYQPAIGVASGCRMTSACMGFAENTRLAERARKQESFDPITGAVRVYNAPKAQLNSDLTPSVDEPAVCKGAIHPDKNASRTGLIRHDIPAEEVEAGPISRVTESCLQSTLIPEGQEAPIQQKPLVRRAGGECDAYIIPQDKLGPGLVTTVKETRPMRCQDAAGAGRSQLQQTPYGIMIGGGEEPPDMMAAPPMVGGNNGQYVRMYGRA